MTIRIFAQISLICLVMVMSAAGLSLSPAIAQPPPPSQTPAKSIFVSADQLSGTIAVDTIRALASHWDANKLAGPIQLSECADCPDAATRLSLSALSVLGGLQDVSKTNDDRFRLLGPEAGTFSIDKDVIEVSPGRDIRFNRVSCYAAKFERGEARITIAVQGTHEMRAIIIMHIRPVAPATFAPVSLGKPDVWTWDQVPRC